MLFLQHRLKKKRADRIMLEFLDLEYIKMVKILDFVNKSVEPVSIDEIARHIKTVRKTANTLLVLIKSELKDFDFEIRMDSKKNIT